MVIWWTCGAIYDSISSSKEIICCPFLLMIVCLSFSFSCITLIVNFQKMEGPWHWNMIWIQILSLLKNDTNKLTMLCYHDSSFQSPLLIVIFTIINSINFKRCIYKQLKIHTSSTDPTYNWWHATILANNWCIPTLLQASDYLQLFSSTASMCSK